jgi:hypothetical protein
MASQKHEKQESKTESPVEFLWSVPVSVPTLLSEERSGLWTYQKTVSMLLGFP